MFLVGLHVSGFGGASIDVWMSGFGGALLNALSNDLKAGMSTVTTTTTAGRPPVVGTQTQTETNAVK